MRAAKKPTYAAAAAAAAKARAKAKARANAAAKAKAKAKAKALSRARAREQASKDTRRRPGDAKPTSDRGTAQIRVAAGQSGDGLGGPLALVWFVAVVSVALALMLLAALPLGTLDHLLAAKAHYRTEQMASFVDGHRVDIVVAGVAMLLVAVVVVLPTVAG